MNRSGCAFLAKDGFYAERFWASECLSDIADRPQPFGPSDNTWRVPGGISQEMAGDLRCRFPYNRGPILSRTFSVHTNLDRRSNTAVAPLQRHSRVRCVVMSARL